MAGTSRLGLRACALDLGERPIRQPISEQPISDDGDRTYIDPPPRRGALPLFPFVPSKPNSRHITISMVQILDNYYLAITFLVSLGLQGSLLAFAFLAQSDKLTDLGGSLNFFLIAILTLCAGGTYTARQVVASVLVMVWAVRLGGFLFYRVLKTGTPRLPAGIRARAVES